jgi:hypothetical protein
MVIPDRSTMIESYTATETRVLNTTYLVGTEYASWEYQIALS